MAETEWDRGWTGRNEWLGLFLACGVATKRNLKMIELLTNNNRVRL